MIFLKAAAFQMCPRTTQGQKGGHGWPPVLNGDSLPWPARGAGQAVPSTPISELW